MITVLAELILWDTTVTEYINTFMSFFENLYAAKPSLRTDLAAADYQHASHPIPWLESKLVLG